MTTYCRTVNDYIRNECPDTCFNKTHYDKVEGKICNIYNNKYLCKVAKRKKEIAKDCSRKNISILNNDRNTMNIRKGKKYNIYNVNRKPKKLQFKNAEERSYYNAVFNKVYNSVLTMFYDKRLKKRTGISVTQKNRLIRYAQQYAVMLLRRHYASYGPTNDGWPAVSITGSEVPMFNEEHDGYGTKNCCIAATDKKQIRKALTNGSTFCKITSNSKCSTCNCGYLRSIA
jgi:hypothetical protein